MQPKVTFESWQLKSDLQYGIYAHGVEYPSEIQQQLIPQILAGKNVICHNNCGTGKTTALAIAALQQIDENINDVQIIIITQHKELVCSTNAVVTSIGQRMHLKSQNTEKLQKLNITVGTPISILNMLTKDINICNDIKTIMIDDIDEILERGFNQQLDQIMSSVPKSTQLVLVCKNMSEAILKKVIDPVIVEQK
ncbi:Eukaryotic_translation initiation factor 4A [Hexamita inflata]|uniref:Eukaryotic translation initiation factor 4A n=1 Tax=Hexamita inflata TaxID=28002 RepID=A0AA86PGK6_9EUKA|nr:Eukaryotic translation initiation factor 4A [Hexamita inflata]CAI9937927.1 Eukaryotic translation initiation factor 4A [Hexamita inflata]